MTDAILVLNAGSSSIKFSLFLSQTDQLQLRLRGQIEGLYTAPRFVAKDAAGAKLKEHKWDEGMRLGHDGAIDYLIATKEKVGARFVLDDTAIADIKAHTADGRKYLPQFQVEVKTAAGEVVARVVHTLYIRKKQT